MNKTILRGNLVKDPVVESVARPDGPVKVCTFTIAVNSRAGRQDETVYFEVTTWRGLAENCSNYLAKGRQVLVEGQMRKPYVWINEQDGKAYCKLCVTASEVEFLTPRERKGDADDAEFANGASEKAAPKEPASVRSLTPVEEDLPF